MSDYTGTDTKKLPPIGQRRVIVPYDDRPTWIYTLAHPETGEVRYVGQTVRTLKHRLSMHVHDARSKARTHIHNWVRSVGRPVIQGLARVEGVMANDIERGLIERLRARGCRLVNATSGGRERFVWRPNPEQRAKMSVARKGKPRVLSAEGRERIREAIRLRVVTDETRAKIRAFNLGRKASAETKAKMAASATGRTATPETREKLRRANIGRKMGPHSQEWRVKVSAALKGRRKPPISAETRAKMSASAKARRASSAAKATMSAAQTRRRQLERQLGSVNV